MNAFASASNGFHGAAGERVRERLKTIFAQGKIRGENGLNDIFPIGVTAGRGRVVREVCRAADARATLEVGMAWGISTLFILDALLESGVQPVRHVAIDPFQATTFYNAARITLRELGLEGQVEFYEEISLLALARLLGQGRQFDFAFIDGDHRFDACFPDFCLIDHLLSPGGVVLFDDTWLEAVNLTANYALTNLGYTEFEPPCAVPVCGSRPMLRGLVKPAHEPKRNGIWTEPLVPFFLERQPKVSSPPQPAAESRGGPHPLAALLCDLVINSLDCVAGQCRSARILFNGAYGARAPAVLEQAEPLLADLRRVIAQPQRAAAALDLLASIEEEIETMKRQRNGSNVAVVLQKIEQLKRSFHQRPPKAPE